jgi:hypothetical protein
VTRVLTGRKNSQNLTQFYIILWIFSHYAGWQRKQHALPTTALPPPITEDTQHSQAAQLLLHLWGIPQYVAPGFAAYLRFMKATKQEEDQ